MDEFDRPTIFSFDKTTRNASVKGSKLFRTTTTTEAVEAVEAAEAAVEAAEAAAAARERYLKHRAHPFPSEYEKPTYDCDKWEVGTDGRFMHSLTSRELPQLFSTLPPLWPPE